MKSQKRTKGGGKIKTITEIVETLSQQIDKINNDQISPQKANAVCNSVGKIIGAVRLQFDFCRLTGVKPNLPVTLLEVGRNEDISVIRSQKKKAA